MLREKSARERQQEWSAMPPFSARYNVARSSVTHDWAARRADVSGSVGRMAAPNERGMLGGLCDAIAPGSVYFAL